ncbi:hypothetical protein Belba_3509 [Belliella baltica DSM 15883]|uniref:Uncharacterized protein n=1 Tax=Belliella baltica (strain DSM 15883 / CIP 108006 / LMG 21964 / BA134) TaxID=866536 RepID=I3Z9U2_BELBD|nr:hypothetical protein [Belliella baltica]AFL86010.1 hypothetical protein Belba_3509 [Belliella baltica DSM 15883]
MAGMTGFDMINSTKNNRNLRSGRTKISDNPYNQGKENPASRDPKNYSEMINERFDRRDQRNQCSVIIFVVLSLLMGIFFYYLMVA